MIEEQRRRLSELQDGELDAVDLPLLLDEIAGDAELRATWGRYQLIGLALRGETIDPATRVVADRVRQALDPAPTRLRPRPRRILSEIGFHPGTGIGLALAASAAFVAFVSAPVFFKDVGSGVALPAVSAQLVGRVPPAGRRWQLDRPEIADKLDLFLVTHQASAPGPGTKGMFPYATLVSYEVPR